MILSDYVAAFTLVGVRHRHAKVAWAYKNAPPPAWMGAGGAASSGTLALPPADPSVPMLEAPAVMDMAADGSAPALRDSGGDVKSWGRRLWVSPC
jgi:hypothetical protein